MIDACCRKDTGSSVDGVSDSGDASASLGHIIIKTIATKAGGACTVEESGIG